MDQDRPAVDVPAHVLDYLGEQKTLTLASASLSGVPHAATLVYASEGMVIYFATRPGTTTVRNVQQNPVVAFTIDEYTEDWSKTRGIQARGECQEILSPDEIRRVVQLFQTKFPFLAGGSNSNLAFFRLSPSELQFINNADGGTQVGQTLGTEYRRSLVYSVFRSLPHHQVETIAAKLGTVKVNAGEIIVRQGAPADKFFIIVEGELEVSRDDQGDQPLARLSAGQFFGEIAILRDTPRTATVRAVTPATLLSMDRETFQSLVAQSLSTTQDFDRVIQQRLSSLTSP